MMFLVASICVGLSMLIILIRLFAGNTPYDRVLALNVFGTCTVLLIGLMGFVAGRPDFLDIALLYALINFVGTIAVLKFLRYHSLGDRPGRFARRKAAERYGTTVPAREKAGSKAGPQ